MTGSDDRWPRAMVALRTANLVAVVLTVAESIFVPMGCVVLLVVPAPITALTLCEEFPGAGWAAWLLSGREPEEA